jgi:hypothetical protein
MFSARLLTANPSPAHTFEETEGEMFIHNKHFDGDMIELSLDDWKLPPPIEHEDAMSGDMALDIILGEVNGVEGGEALAFLFDASIDPYVF